MGTDRQMGRWKGRQMGEKSYSQVNKWIDIKIYEWVDR
jgi:hypothetical protein